MIRKIEPSFNPGSVHCNVDKEEESRDFHFTANEKVILNGACKLRQNNCDISELKKIINGFESFTGNREAKKSYCGGKINCRIQIKNIPSNYLIYKAKFIQNMENGRRE